MHHRPVLLGLFAAVFLALAGSSSAGTSGSAVFVQTNEASGNQIAVYDRNADGTLTRAGTYATGGLGSAALPGTESDRLATQGSLALVGHRLLIAVNAGSDTISVFRVRGDRLDLEQVLGSGGQFPAGIGVHGDLVYVLNAGGTGIVQGFRILGDALAPIVGSARSLGLANSNPPFFLTSPGQVGFTPDGKHLIVTTKVSGSLIDVFQVEPDGTLSAAPVANPSATPVPFAFTFAHGRLVMGEAGTSSLTTYDVQHDGTVTNPKSQSDGQGALCWVTRVGPFFYVSNTATSNISSFRVGPGGQPVLVSAVAATTSPGTIDSAKSGRFLYVETGTLGTVDEFRVGSDGSLTPIGSATDLPPGIEGIAAA
jgi:6-phosphogluconolactonase (cycloisomerase 2 family)